MKYSIDKKYSKESGVYIIRNSVNRRVYIGSAKHLRNRFVSHRNTLTRNCHKSKQLQAFVNKYSSEVLVYELLELCSVAELIQTEQKYLDAYKPFGRRGFNTLVLAGSPLGFRHSEESKRKLSESHKGRKHSLQARKNMSEGQRNRDWRLTEDGRRRQSLARKGRKLSEGTKLLISIAHSGRKHTKQSRENMSKAHRGKALTESQKQKLSEYMLEKNPFGKLVLNTETGVYYDSGIQAAGAHGLHAVGLNRKLRGERNNNTQFILA